MLDEKDFQMLKDNIDQAQDQYGQIGMIVIDTLARSMNGDENSTSDMNAFIEKVDDLKDSYGSAINIIHHTGHSTNQRARGSSALPGALDWEYRCVRSDMNDEMYLKLEQTLVKDGNPMKPLNFKFVEQTFMDMSSGALRKVESDDVPKQKTPTENEALIFEAMSQYQAASKDPINAGLRHKDIKKLVKQKSDMADSTISTCLTRLKNSGRVIHEGDFYRTNLFEDGEYLEH